MVPPIRTLENSGIRFEADPRNITQLPPFAEKLKGLLLNFEEIVPLFQKLHLESLCEEDRGLVENEVGPARAIYCDSGHRTYKARWDAAFKLRDKARHLQAREKESTWNGLMTNFVFEDINNQASDQGIVLKDLLSWGSNETFTNTVPLRGQLSDNGDHQPKPDFWFGLGLYSDKQLSRLKGLEIADEGVRYFSQEKLEDLNTTHCDDFIYKPVKSRKYAAFPWMVVELKKEFGDEHECLRQAANASHTSLVLCERLAAQAAGDASPLVAFTSIGPKAKVFIAYKSEQDPKDELYRISCIWSGNVEHILHAVQLRRIVDQLIFWALRIFKPWVTGCLEQWYGEGIEEGEEDGEEDGEEEGAEGREDNSTSKDQQTQTLDDSGDSLLFRNDSESSDDRSEKDHASGSDTVESDQSWSSSIPGTGREEWSDPQSESRLHSRDQSISKESSGSGSPGLSAVYSKSTHASPIEADEGSAQSTPELESRLHSRDQSISNESSGSGSSAAYSKSTHASPIKADEGSAQSTPELESRLHNVRIRAREASIRSLILTNRAQLLRQRIRLEKIRSWGF